MYLCYTKQRKPLKMLEASEGHYLTASQQLKHKVMKTLSRMLKDAEDDIIIKYREKLKTREITESQFLRIYTYIISGQVSRFMVCRILDVPSDLLIINNYN